MLTLLRIKNFAVIKEQEIEFSKGLNVITGETGAGKSIILQALSLILGGRPKSKFVRKGADSWEIEAAFDLSSLADTDYEALPEIAKNQERELLLYRSASEARSRILINGQLGNVSLLQQATQNIINICGQGEFVSLLDSKSHIHLLDQFGQHEKLCLEVNECFQKWKTAKKQADSLAALREQSALRQAELEFIVQDLSVVDWQPGLRQSLEEKLARLNNAEHLIAELKAVLDGIEAESGITSNISDLQGQLQLLLRKDAGLAEGVSRVQSVKAELESLTDFLNDYLKGLDLDEEQLSQMRDKLALVAALERKYRLSDVALGRLLEDSKKALLEIEDIPDQSQADEQAKIAFKVFDNLAKKLSKLREAHAEQLAKAVNAELAELSMPEARLAVALSECEPGPQGYEKAEFIAATNKNQDAQPLKLIASGGELARVLLVLKKLLRDKTGVNVLVFDEVDSGVSGKVARAVGEKLKSLAKQSQVLCITHLAQVASLADHHLAVQKSAKEGVTVVKALSQPERVEEVAKLLAGYEVTAAVRQSARELLG